MSYDMLDRFLRNNLGDDDYAEYLIALDSLCAPPQREWVGLTDDDCKGMSAGDKVVAMWANRILKEKNNGA